MTLGFVAGIPDTVLLAGGTFAVATAGGYVAHSVVRRRRAMNAEPDSLARLRETVAKRTQVAFVVPESPGIDALAAALGLQAICQEWGVTGSVLSQGAVTSEDSKAFTNIFDIDLQSIDDAPEELSSYDGAIVVGGGGAVPHFSNNPPVIGVIRHRPAAEDDILVISKSEDGSTSTTVTHLLREADIVPDQRVATALLYGVRAGTREFRRVSSHRDYESASYLHDAADHSQIEALRSPGMSDETFDVMGAAIANRERRASFAVTNVGSVPAVSSLEEAADTLLRLDGVSSAAVFGIHDGTIVTSCRAEDVRVNALDILEKAFDDSETIGGNADAAMARVPLGLFARIDDHHQATLDDLIDASTRKALFSAFESS